MKFLCDSCGTKYSISDERVRGRVLKIRCKKCDFVITVREDVHVASTAVMVPSELDKALDNAFGEGGSEQTTVGGLPGSLGAPTGKAKADAVEKDDWYLSFDGEQEGPFSLDAALARARKEQGSDKEIHAWRPGFLVWLPVEEVPELQPLSAKDSAAKRAPVRATTPTPIGPTPIGPTSIGSGRAAGAVSSQVARDPSGPRAALSVSAGARSDGARPAGAAASSLSKSGSAKVPLPAAGLPGPAPLSAAAMSPSGGMSPSAGLSSAGTPAGAHLELRKQGAPPIPSSARVSTPPAKPVAPGRAPAVPTPVASNGSGARPLPGSPLAAAAPSVGVGQPAAVPSLAAVAAAAVAPAAEAAPDLNISNEASGLVDIASLAASHFGKPTATPAFRNGHTGRVPTIASEPLAALDPGEANTSAPAPVVVVAGAAPRGASPLFKWAALVAILISLGLGGGVWYLLTHRPEAETIIVTEPSRRADDSPITVADPGSPHTAGNDVKKLAAVTSKKGGVSKAAVTPAAGTKPVADNLSGSQRALADLYKDGGDRATPQALQDPRGGAQGGQVSQAAIIAAVNANKRQLTLCYERALKHDSSIKSGRVPIQVTVGMSGRVTSVSIPEPQYATSELGQCFVQSVKRWSFPQADAAYSTEFPFILQGQ